MQVWQTLAWCLSTAQLADSRIVTAAILGQAAKGTYLSLGPTCRHD